MEATGKSYLGLDFSTQQLKGLAIDDKLKVVCEAAVQFDNDLPEYRTQNGVNKNRDTLTVTAPAIMWVKALDMLLERLKVAGLDLATVAAISGSGQQHGSVYWRKGASDMLRDLDASKFLHDQLQGAFSVRDSPVWMDSSTEVQCRNLETAVGGAQCLADITGSRAFERFTGNQIAKIWQTKRDAYANTERISLVSSFGATLFLGRYAPIDFSDGSGMNLLNIRTHRWDRACLDACAPDLEAKLGEPVASHEVLGTVAPYFVDRYGFPPDCSVVAFTGDNPASLAGLRLRGGDLLVSLGTSDTVLMWLSEANPALEGHVMVNPVASDAFMGMLCYKNGSLTRQRVRDHCAGGSWDIFASLIDSTPRGNFGNIGMYFDLKEILPPVVGDFKFNKSNERVAKFSQEVEARAVVEGQFLAKRVHAERLGFTTGGRVLATGGASKNPGIIQVLADVFGASVYTLGKASANAACLGAAYLALFGSYKKAEPGLSFDNVISEAEPFHLAAKPSADAASVYGPMAERYRTLEHKVVSLQVQSTS